MKEKIYNVEHKEQDIKPIENKELRVYVIDIVPPIFPQELIQDRLAELESLVTTYKWVVIVKAIQKKLQKFLNRELIEKPEILNYLIKEKKKSLQNL